MEARLFLDQLLQFHSIERGYLARHGDLLSFTWRQIHDETCDRWETLTKSLRIHDGTYMIPALELPTVYNQQESLEQLHGFYSVTRAAAAAIIRDPIVGALAKRVHDRYDATAYFLSGYIPFIRQHHVLTVDNDVD